MYKHEGSMDLKSKISESCICNTLLNNLLTILYSNESSMLLRNTKMHE